MALPRPLLPTYDLTLPSNGQVVKFRPFIMKEEKLLLIALEGGEEIKMLDAIHDIVSACTEGVVDTTTAPLFDVQYAFLQIRSKSVAEIADFIIACGECKYRIPSEINLTNIEIEKVPGHTNKIYLTDEMGVIMKYPTIKHLDILANYKSSAEVYKIIAECIDVVFDKEELHKASDETPDDLLTFIDNLPVSQFNKIQTFFKTMPVLRHVHNFTCPKCGKANVLTLEGIESFFV